MLIDTYELLEVLLQTKLDSLQRRRPRTRGHTRRDEGSVPDSLLTKLPTASSSAVVANCFRNPTTVLTPVRIGCQCSWGFEQTGSQGKKIRGRFGAVFPPLIAV